MIVICINPRYLFPVSKIGSKRRCAAVGSLLLVPMVAFGANEGARGDEASQGALPTILVIGTSGEDRERQPAASTLVTAEELRLQQPRSTEEALRHVPGVSIKPEEETAIVANIGIRGLSSADYKTLILEDGVPVAPGLFVGNGRYYNPRIERMSGIEILRGAGSLRFGPSTIGGVINYQTKNPEPGIRAEVHAASFNTHEWGLEAGAKTTNGEVTFGVVINRADSDGFMDKGFRMSDVMLKAGVKLREGHRLGLKYTDYENNANISYRGLFLSEYRAGVDRNPAPDDWFLTGRRSIDLSHEWQLSERLRINTLFFSSEMFRDYWRYTTDNNASSAAQRWIYTDSLNGNNRHFERVGVDSRLFATHEIFGLDSDAELGLRYMSEEMRDTTVGATRATPRSGGISRDVIDSAASWSLHIQNRISLTDRFSVTAGLRTEIYEQRREDLRRSSSLGNRVETENAEWLPGIGMTWRMSDGLQIFANAYKAFSPALNGDALNGLEDQKLQAERSVNMEVGLRGYIGTWTYEAAVFRMDFDNQLIPANSNSQFQVTNGGETLHQGLEFGIGAALNSAWSWNANLTYIADAEFVGDRYSRLGVLTTPSGNRIPYTPELIANFSLSFERGPVRSALHWHHTSAQFTDVLNTRAINESLSGFFTGRIDGYTIADVSVLYRVDEKLEFSATVKNVADVRYIASLRQGIYVGPERSVDVGLSYRF
jgi:Fe(3+) dicitrate transport protein